MRSKTIGTFQKAIILGLSVQVLVIFASTFYFFGGSGFDGNSSDDEEQRSILGALVKLAAENLQRRMKMGVNGDADDSKKKRRELSLQHPLSGMIQTHVAPASATDTRSGDNGQQDQKAHQRQDIVSDPYSRRNCFAFTAVPKEIGGLLDAVVKLLQYDRYANAIDCIHLSIPHRAIRFSNTRYPTNSELLDKYPVLRNDPRIVLHRLPDYGPMTR